MLACSSHATWLVVQPDVSCASARMTVPKDGEGIMQHGRWWHRLALRGWRAQREEHRAGVPSTFDFSSSTADFYRRDDTSHVGKYRRIRARLDGTYHGTYSHERQALQDELPYDVYSASTHQHQHQHGVG